MNNVRLIATDLDGTFLKNDRTVSVANIAALHELGKKGIVRVAATGRNLSKVKEVIFNDMPFDFIVFSSGAGVFNWQTNELMANQNINASEAQKLLTFFIEKNINFNVYCPIPDNHNFFFFKGEKGCKEFERYLLYNKDSAKPLNRKNLPQDDMCQFLIIIKNDVQLFEQLKIEIEALSSEIRVIRASSPLSDGFIWIEVFHKSVSKGNGLKKICNRLNIKKNETMGIGNDYNDFDLLGFTKFSFLTANSPEEIRHKYPLVPENEADAFAHSAQMLLD